MQHKHSNSPRSTMAASKQVFSVIALVVLVAAVAQAFPGPHPAGPAKLQEKSDLKTDSSYGLGYAYGGYGGLYGGYGGYGYGYPYAAGYGYGYGYPSYGYSGLYSGLYGGLPYYG